MEKQFGDLSQFKGRDVELFRSSDLKNTAIYFTRVKHENFVNLEHVEEALSVNHPNLKRFGLES